MLIRLNSLKGHTIEGAEGAIGNISGFYFDDNQWALRYFVVATRALQRARILLSPVGIQSAEWQAGRITTALTADEINHSPSINFGELITGEREAEVAHYFGWPVYWESPTINNGPVTESATASGATVIIERKAIYHTLRSTEKLDGFTVNGIDGTIGTIRDLVTDTENWQIEYMVVATGDWMDSDTVLLSTEWIEAVDWDGAQMNLRMSRDTVKSSPVFDHVFPIPADYETRLLRYYGLPARQPQKQR